MKTLNHRSGGWSIVELVASTTLLVVGLLSLALGFYGSSNLAQKARQNNSISIAYRNVVAGLEASELASLQTAYGPSSGNDRFWLGDDNVDEVKEQRVYYEAPLKPALTGSITLLTNESALPATWSGFGSGLDMNCDGTLELVTTLASGVVGETTTILEDLLGGGGSSGGSGSGSIKPLKVLPAQISLTVDGFDGQRNLDLYVILAK